MYDFGDVDDNDCDHCRNSGVFPGDTGWASCLCAAGYERALSEPEEGLERKVDPQDTAVLAYFLELEDRCYVGSPLRVRTRRTEKTVRHVPEENVDGEFHSATFAVVGHHAAKAAVGRSGR